MRSLLATCVLALVLACAGAAYASYPSTFGPVKGNPANALDKLPIDNYRYDHSRRCTKKLDAARRRLDAGSGVRGPGCEGLSPHPAPGTPHL